MGHEIENDIDAERIGDFLGELAEVLLVFPLAFPAIANVTVVDGENHHPLMVVEQRPDVHLFGAFSPEDGL